MREMKGQTSNQNNEEKSKQINMHSSLGKKKVLFWCHTPKQYLFSFLLFFFFLSETTLFHVKQTISIKMKCFVSLFFLLLLL
jgi:hypothetical protein